MHTHSLSADRVRRQRTSRGIAATCCLMLSTLLGGWVDASHAGAEGSMPTRVAAPLNPVGIFRTLPMRSQNGRMQLRMSTRLQEPGSRDYGNPPVDRNSVLLEPAKSLSALSILLIKISDESHLEAKRLVTEASARSARRSDVEMVPAR